MLSTIAIVLILLWLFGMVSAYTMGGLIHVLLVVAVLGFRTGAVTSVSIWLLETFPALQNFG